MAHQTIQNIENQSQNQQGQQLQSLQPLQTKFLILHLSNPKSIKQTAPVTSNFPTPINLLQTSNHNFILTLSIYPLSFQNNLNKCYYHRVTTNLENLENSGNLKNCQNLRENSGKFEFFWKNLENVKYAT